MDLKISKAYGWDPNPSFPRWGTPGQIVSLSEFSELGVLSSLEDLLGVLNEIWRIPGACGYTSNISFLSALFSSSKIHDNEFFNIKKKSSLFELAVWEPKIFFLNKQFISFLVGSGLVYHFVMKSPSDSFVKCNKIGMCLELTYFVQYICCTKHQIQ